MLKSMRALFVLGKKGFTGQGHAETNLDEPL
jgi:hypothetical protein